MKSDALRFTVSTSGGSQVCDVSEDVEINSDNLSEEFSRQPGLQAWWGALLENAQHALRLAETEFETYEATLSKTLRAQHAGEKVTEGKLDAFLKSDAGYAARRGKIDALKHQVELLKVSVRAVEEKGRMLMSLGAHKRAEMEMAGMRLFGSKPG